MEFQNATRIQESVTSMLERRTLLWLAAHLPSWVSSDQLTFLGFVAMFLAGCSYLLARWHAIGLLLATMFRDFGAGKKPAAPPLRFLC